MKTLEPHREHGVTLIELMIVIVVVAILASIAVPTYRNYVLRSHRTDATAALLRVRAAQERFFLQNNAYVTTAVGLTQAPPVGLGFPTDTNGVPISEHGFFNLAIGADPDPALPPGTPSYLITAVATGGQLDDDDCRTLSITDRGVRGAADAGGTTSQTIIDTCWR